jgi:hypothetical protein
MEHNSMTGKKKDYNVPAEEFVQTWQKSSSTKEVAEALGMPEGIVLARESRYRQAGMNLKKMKSKKKTDYNVPAEEFVRVWEVSDSVKEVSDKLGMPEGIVLARASGYRQMGVMLKKMKRNRKKKLDIDALNNIIEEIRAAKKQKGNQ